MRCFGCASSSDWGKNERAAVVTVTVANEFAYVYLFSYSVYSVAGSVKDVHAEGSEVVVRDVDSSSMVYPHSIPTSHRLEQVATAVESDHALAKASDRPSWWSRVTAPAAATNTSRPSRAFYKRIITFNPRSTVLMIHDLHTLAVLRAFRAFLDHRAPILNMIRVLTEIGAPGSFKAGVYVDIHHGPAICHTGI
jgi:hypothetical protein